MWFFQVAIKSIRKEKIKDEQDLVHIRREIEIMSTLCHPHIITIYEGSAPPTKSSTLNAPGVSVPNVIPGKRRQSIGLCLGLGVRSREVFVLKKARLHKRGSSGVRTLMC